MGAHLSVRQNKFFYQTLGMNLADTRFFWQNPGIIFIIDLSNRHFRFSCPTRFFHQTYWCFHQTNGRHQEVKKMFLSDKLRAPAVQKDGSSVLFCKLVGCFNCSFVDMPDMVDWGEGHWETQAWSTSQKYSIPNCLMCFLSDENIWFRMKRSF